MLQLIHEGIIDLKCINNFFYVFLLNSELGAADTCYAALFEGCPVTLDQSGKKLLACKTLPDTSIYWANLANKSL